MTSTIKGIVSKNKIRYKEDISKNIIAMGYPAETLERFYRNHIDDVVRFFESRHQNRYKIYNLCSESKRRYDVTKFNGPVELDYAFQDHNPPPFTILKPFCESLHKWLKAHSLNVAAIHCKAGKGRTGVMVCAYLVHAGGCTWDNGDHIAINDAESALEYYGRHRTHDSKGVTIPSQKRYVYYYEELVKRNLEYKKLPLRFNSIMLTSIPVINGGSYTLTCEISEVPSNKIKSFDIEVKKGSKQVVHKLDEELFLTGDIKFEFYVRKIKEKKIFQFCLNTFFVQFGTDAVTITSEQCAKCSGDTVSVMSNKCLQPSKDSPSDRSVIDSSFLNLVNSSRNENFRLCDCHNSSNSVECCSHHNTTASQSSIETDMQCNPSSSHPSTSSLNNENKISLSSSASSSSSSSQSLNRKQDDTEFELKKLPKRDMFVVLSKEKLDKAYKDISNKLFTSDFKVVVSFTSLGYEPPIKPSPKFSNQYCTTGYDASSTDSENYSEEDDEISDLESNLPERKSMLPFVDIVNQKK
ncbi:hypothetical protein BLOT_003336, partial [Blomia tropicalis]